MLKLGRLCGLMPASSDVADNTAVVAVLLVGLEHDEGLSQSVLAWLGQLSGIWQICFVAVCCECENNVLFYFYLRLAWNG